MCVCVSCFSSVQSLSRVQLFVTPWITARQASLSITNSWSSLRLTSIELVMSSSHPILCHPLLLLPPIPPSIRVFPNKSNFLVKKKCSRFITRVLIPFSEWYAAAAAAKSPQSCPTLCNPIQGSLSGFPVPGILQARTLEWGAIAFSVPQLERELMKTQCSQKQKM